MKKLWLDLELRKDIDDYITLITALETDSMDVGYISIHNPSQKELLVLQNTLLKYKDSLSIFPKVVISGEITEYLEEHGDTHECLDKFVIENDSFEYLKLNDVINNDKTLGNFIYFTGGSLYTLSEIMKLYPKVDAYIQGGYAGKNIVPSDKALKKFKKRESVPSWNLNLDIDSTLSVLSHKESNLHFISKNICHASIISQDDLKGKDGFAIDVLNDYYNANNDARFKKKAMHDVLAFITISNKEFVEFKQVDLIPVEVDDGKPMKWKSELNSESNVKISVDFDYEKFKKEFFKRLTGSQVKKNKQLKDNKKNLSIPR